MDNYKNKKRKQTDEIPDELKAELRATLLGRTIKEENIKQHLNPELHAFGDCENIRRTVEDVFKHLPQDVVDNLTDPNSPVIIVTTSGKPFCRKWSSKKRFTFKQGFRLLCLNEDLKTEDTSIVQGIIAHELAHLFLGHKRHDEESKNLEQEFEADAEACKWGFKDEIVKALKNEVSESSEALKRLVRIYELQKDHS